jgi:hypothetical protein
MDRAHEHMPRPSTIPDADIDALMAQIRSRICASNRSPTVSPVGRVDGAKTGERTPSIEAGASDGLQAEFNAVIMHTLDILTQQIRQLQRDLALLASHPSVRSHSVANDAAPDESQALGVASVPASPRRATGNIRAGGAYRNTASADSDPRWYGDRESRGTTLQRHDS